MMNKEPQNVEGFRLGPFIISHSLIDILRFNSSRIESGRCLTG